MPILLEIIMASKDIKNTKSQAWMPFLFFFTLALGILIGAWLMKNNTWGGHSSKKITALHQILQHVASDYVDSVSVDTLVEKTFDDLISGLDPHTVYISPSDLALSHSQLEESYDGIGVEFNIYQDTLFVIAPIAGGPSEKVGILSGDKIIGVNDEIMVGKNLTNKHVYEKLRGPKGSEVILTVLRGKSEKKFSVTREAIPQTSVDVGYMINTSTGYIKISRFADDTYEAFRSQLEILLSKGMKELVLDLTGNSGGYLHEAVDIVDEFISGNRVIVETKGKKSRYNQTHQANKEGLFEQQPLIVLIDQGSASASEIVAGALQDYDRAWIVGQKSYGKGLVQVPMKLADGGELRLTISRYYIPSGRSIQKPYDNFNTNPNTEYFTANGRKVYAGGGIKPDFEIKEDTLNTQKIISEMYRIGILRTFSLQFFENNKTKLQQMGMEKFIAEFSLNDAQLNDLKSRSKEIDLSQWNLEKRQIALHVKALIGRMIWGNEGYFPVLNSHNKMIIKALELIKTKPTI